MTPMPMSFVNFQPFRGAPLLALAVLLLMPGCTRKAAEEAQTMPPVSLVSVPSAAADWKLLDLDGNEVSSERFRGKVVVLDFWATWCVPCVEEMPAYIALQKKYGDEGLAIVGVSMDRRPVADVKKFVEEKALNYTIVMGDEVVHELYGGFGQIPVTYLIDRDGVIRDAKTGVANPKEYEKKILALLR